MLRDSDKVVLKWERGRGSIGRVNGFRVLGMSDRTVFPVVKGLGNCIEG